MLIFLLSFLQLQAQASSDMSAHYQDVQVYMRQLVQEYPQTTKLITIGQSDTGETIEGLEIGDGPVHNLVVSTHHGNEYGSTEVAKAFAAEMAAQPIAGQTLYVIPVLNVSGFNARDRYELGNDPNRDYPGPCGTEGPFKLKSTAALAKFIDEKNIVTSATLHTFFPTVAYPWGFATATPQDLVTADQDFFIGLAQAATQFSKYQIGNSTQVIYPAQGAYEDYAYWKHGIWSLLFEIGETHTPTPEQVEDMIRTNVPGLKLMFKNSKLQRANDHDFKGKCDNTRMSYIMDLHNE